jgi:hypothetical protein
VRATFNQLFQTVNFANKLKKKVVDIIKGQFITVCFDGWTSKRHEKVSNFCIHCKGKMFYWSSTTVMHNNEAELTAALRQALEEIQRTGAHVVAVGSL